jgi:hypothetical protein
VRGGWEDVHVVVGFGDHHISDNPGVDRHAHQQVLAGDGDFIPATRPDPSAAKASGMASPTSFPST